MISDFLCIISENLRSIRVIRVLFNHRPLFNMSLTNTKLVGISG